jgi:hypothetical protein
VGTIPFRQQLRAPVTTSFVKMMHTRLKNVLHKAVKIADFSELSSLERQIHWSLCTGYAELLLQREERLRIH